ncbi:MAG: ATP-binding protein [Treponema sp.]|nr:ATP-binding protein [Treponema sp.]
MVLSFIKKTVFAGKTKTATAPQIFLVLCFYAAFTTIHGYIIVAPEAKTAELLVRLIIDVIIIGSFLIGERSRKISVPVAAFLSPSLIMTAIFAGAVYSGDVLVFQYMLGAAMFSLTYLKPKSLLMYICYSAIISCVIIAGFKINMLGEPYSYIHNILSMIVSIALCVIVYIFCGSYAKVLNNLVEAEAKTAQASKAKGDFLSNMSHEIRTPMNAIIGMTSIAEASNDIGQIKSAITKIRNASAYLLGVINDILDMSKIEAGKFELAYASVDFEKIIQGVVNIIQFRVTEKHQKFNVYIDEHIPKILQCDSQRLAQVITNLLSNAVKFTPEQGEIGLNIELLKIENDVCEIKTEVSDTGIGISEEQQKRLFHPFEQAETSTARKFGGTGLGLSISKQIVEMMGGKIQVTSELNKGSIFTFTFLAEKAEEPEAADAAGHSPTGHSLSGHSPAGLRPDESFTPGCFKGHRILLADDVEINREIIVTLLEPTQLAIDCVANGTDVLRMFTEAPERYEMIFMDVQMPELDGYEATRRIRAKEAELRSAGYSRNIPIVAMTANVFREDIEKCLAAGMNGHIGKPLDFSEVLSKLHTYLLKGENNETT